MSVFVVEISAFVYSKKDKKSVKYYKLELKLVENTSKLFYPQ